MKSNHRRIGEFIRLVDERNYGLKVSTLLGLSISKEFIPSVANIVGSDMENYKIIRKNQFACSLMQVRRDKKIPVALLKEIDEAIISQAYQVFEIENTEKLLPEYLMMWFSRSEFDREACFYAVGGVRGSLEWDDFCNLQLLVPSIERQKKIVKEYSAIVNGIKINEELILKLEEAAQAVYKQWFVDFEFPNEYGNPYKSSGGEMIYNPYLDKGVPKGWTYKSWRELAKQFTGFPFNGDNYSLTDGISVLRGENVTERNLRWDTHKKWSSPSDEKYCNYLLKENDIVIGMDGSKVGKNWCIISRYQLPLLIAQRVSCVRANNHEWQPFLYFSMFIGNFEGYVSKVHTGTSVPHISGEQIMDFPILIPHDYLLSTFCLLTKPIIDNCNIYRHQILKLNELSDALLTSLSQKV